MKKAIIYGCGNIGKFVYEYFKNQYDILFFVDKKAAEIKKYGGGVKVCEPQVLTEYSNVTIIVASIWYREMLEDMKNMGITNSDIVVFKMGLETVLPSEIEDMLDKRTINLGAWLHQQGKLNLKELTFIAGGSGVLDYMFLKQIALMSGSKEYMEIGTYIGESINILTDCCNKLYSVTLPEESLENYFVQSKNADYQGRLSHNEKIIHYYTDSKVFDFSKHADSVDLYFIDGDHSYQGVYSDTKNIFSNRNEQSIVVWHDFKLGQNEYRAEVIKAVYDALGKDFDNVYVTNNNVCGIYIPKNRIQEFDFLLYERKYQKNAPLYTYNVHLETGVKEV